MIRIVLLGLCLFTVGCATAQRPSSVSVVPADAVLVGEGFVVQHTSLEPATYFVVDDASGRVLVTSYRPGGEDVFFHTSPSELETIARAAGLDPGEMRPMVYMVPGYLGSK